MGRTRFLCSYVGCKSCSPNMRFNIERHVWTQHVRKYVPGMDQSNYVARIHKTYVDRYVVMAEEGIPFLGVADANQDQCVRRGLQPQHSLGDTSVGGEGRMANDGCMGCGFGNRTSDPSGEGSHIDGLGGFDRLSDVFNSAPVHPLRRHSVVGANAGLRRDFDIASSCSCSYFSDVTDSNRVQRRSWDLDNSVPTAKCGGVQHSIKNEDNAPQEQNFFGNSVGHYGPPCQQSFVGLHPSKSLVGIHGLTEQSLVHSMRESTEAESEANVDSLISVAVAQLSPQDQQQLYNAGAHLKMQTSARWPEFNYYLNLANAQDANNSDVWRPVHF